jgi:pyruvate/2-oxoglutarate dehydrogenase complex dihydrolipoamide dehydrogenase (E3) component
MKKYDAIIIGAGQAGVPLAKRLAKAGKKTVLIEKKFIGGTCVNDGCTPTKTWVASAKLAYMAANSGPIGINIKNFKVDMRQIKRRKEDIVLGARNGSQHALESTKNLTVIFGEATFIGEKVILVELNEGGTLQMTADLIFINAGAKAFIPEIEGLKEIEYLTNTSILELEKVPKHLLVIGANYIGLEFGQMFRRFGSKVTILERSKRILAREDTDIAEELHKLLNDEDIDIYTETNTSSIKITKKGKIKATVNVKGDEKRITCSHVLVAAGRAPQTEALNLDKTGVKVNEKGFIIVDDKLETNVKGIYALGDINGGPAFTHISYNDYTIVYRNLLLGENISTKHRDLPYCMYTDPQLGRIGISEEEAKKQKLNVKIAKLPMAHVARALEVGDTRGFMKAVVDPKTKKILGAAVLGPEGGEIMSILQMAMDGGITYENLRFFVFAHPTYAESLNNLFLGLVD